MVLSGLLSSSTSEGSSTDTGLGLSSVKVSICFSSAFLLGEDEDVDGDSGYVIWSL